MTQSNITNIVLAGVGGQGILLASKLISDAALIEGYDIKANEVHGMAQRGGSVIAQIRFGEKVFSPLVKSGSAEFLLGMEIMEAVRHSHYLAADGKAFVNSQRIIPTTVSSGLADYPPDPESLVEESFTNYKMADCLALAQEAGSSKCVNTVMCGWLSPHLPFKDETWETVMKKHIKDRFISMNQRAFQLGKEI